MLSCFCCRVVDVIFIWAVVLGCWDLDEHWALRLLVRNMLPVRCELCAITGLWQRGCDRLRVIYCVCVWHSMRRLGAEARRVLVHRCPSSEMFQRRRDVGIGKDLSHVTSVEDPGTQWRRAPSGCSGGDDLVQWCWLDHLQAEVLNSPVTPVSRLTCTVQVEGAVHAVP